MFQGDFIAEFLVTVACLGTLALVSWLFADAGELETFAAFVLLIGMMWFGPQLYGRDWFHDGYDAGAIFGGYFFYTLLGHNRSP